MRSIGFIILAGIIATHPAVAFERLAYVQPNRESLPPPTSEAEARAHPENLAAKLQQDLLDKKNEISGRKAIHSLCASCLTEKALGQGVSRTSRYDPREGSSVSAESIYRRGRNFDPALVGGGRS